MGNELTEFEARKIKVVLVTGGGTGRATALSFARAGACVAVVDRDTVAGQETADMVGSTGAKAILIPTDVTKSVMRQ